MRLTLAFCAAFAAASPAAAAGFDGVWSVEGTTDVGPCDKTFAGEVVIQNNDVVSSNAAETKAIGSIDASGSVWARLTRKDGLVRASGRFRGASASGAWSSGTAYCGGRWSARRLR